MSAMDSMPPLPACARNEPSRPARSMIRRQLHILLVAQRRQIHGVLHHAELEILAHLLRDLYAHRLLRLGRGAGDVRRKNHVVEPEIGRVLGRLNGKHVERRARHLAALERSRQIRFHHQLAARAIDDAHALLHGGESLGVDDAVGLRREAHVQREIVGLRKELFHGNQRNAVLARHGCGDKRIGCR